MSTDLTPVSRLLDFCALLRTEGIGVGTGQAMDFAAGLSLLDPGQIEDVYWAGRATLTHRRSEIPVYDDCFTRFFLGGDPDPRDERPSVRPPRTEADAVFEVPSGDAPDGRGEEPQTRLGLAASPIAVQRAKDFADCSEDELAAIRRIVRTLRVTPPTRRTRRHRPTHAGGDIDLRRTALETMRRHGEPIEILRRDRKHRPRRLVLILDVSGSMADYSRSLLQFAHSIRRGGRNVEVFCFGTRLTRITAALRQRDPDTALAQAGEEVVDWAGGTQIGASLDEFVRRYGRRGAARGAIVVICSDGLDRGDPALLDSALERLHRLAYRVVWMNPMIGERDDDYVAASLGMAVALPHIDVMWSGHSLESLEMFAHALPEIR